MTITITEFQKNLSHYERIAMKEPILVENTATGVVFTFTAENPMLGRLSAMKAGKGMTHDEVKALE